MSRFAAITFDLDETVWATRAVLERAEKASYGWMCEALPELGRRYNFGGLLGARREHYARYPQMHHDLTWMRKHWMAALGAEFGADDTFAERAFAHWWSHRNRVRLFAGVEDMLTTLGQDHVIGAITNGNADVEQVGCAHLFEFVIVAGEAGASKPDARIFEIALERAGCAAVDAVHVGDDPERDVLGAKRCGMKGVWINPELAAWPGGDTPDAVLRHVTELPEALERL